MTNVIVVIGVGSIGLPTAGMIDAVTLIDHIRKGAFREDEDIVFLHTGGATALFGYKNLFFPEPANR